MAKSKNHTNHNQNKKAHRNGCIRRLKVCRYSSLKYVDPKFRKNRKYAVRGTRKALKEKRNRGE
ncbi:hypothetical protein PCK2_000380 [Pneumocystis canis]|nr:hypothetical protein PCK2_000380 [Pneumocystis canis]